MPTCRRQYLAEVAELRDRAGIKTVPAAFCPEAGCVRISQISSPHLHHLTEATCSNSKSKSTGGPHPQRHAKQLNAGGAPLAEGCMLRILCRDHLWTI